MSFSEALRQLASVQRIQAYSDSPSYTERATAPIYAAIGREIEILIKEKVSSMKTYIANAIQQAVQEAVREVGCEAIIAAVQSLKANEKETQKKDKSKLNPV
ncbi:MAG: hypothetical protein GX428_09185 [Candidatus Atribacteria bacterium]|jgi:hypothetical protein|nr:hypothetical protein [Candidatus Atribacteria bacterium]